MHSLQSTLNGQHIDAFFLNVEGVTYVDIIKDQVRVISTLLVKRRQNSADITFSSINLLRYNGMQGMLHTESIVSFCTTLGIPLTKRLQVIFLKF